MTHADLVKLAGRWLRRTRRLGLVLEDFRTVSTTEQPDAIGWNAWGWSVLIECKASRADFLRDAKKHVRQRDDAMGQERFYLCPPDVMLESDLPEGWGLLHAVARGVRVVRPAPKSLWHRERMREEVPLLLSALRRSLKSGGSIVYTATKGKLGHRTERPRGIGDLRRPQGPWLQAEALGQVTIGAYPWTCNLDRWTCPGCPHHD